MSAEFALWLGAAIFVIAVLYSSVGHAGASGYIAVMSLASLSPDIIKPTALCLNILVAGIASWHFMRAGHFAWRTFWPFALLAVPMAFVGGHVSLPAQAFKVLLGAVLLVAAARFIVGARDDPASSEPPLVPALACGGLIGLLSGLTGTGGGIFLTPLDLFCFLAVSFCDGRFSCSSDGALLCLATHIESPIACNVCQWFLYDYGVSVAPRRLLLFDSGA